MKHNCQDYRELWLLEALPLRAVASTADPEGAACPDCAAWQKHTVMQIRLLTSMRPLELPATHGASESLEDALAHSGADEQVVLHGTIEVCLDNMLPLEAPLELAQLVAAALSHSAAGPMALDPLGGVSSRTPPSVLDRLVDEEMGAPLSHQSARIMGRLSALRAPAALQELVSKGLAGSRRHAASTRWGSWLTFLAACLVGWIAVRSGAQEEVAPRRRLTIVHASSLAELSPLARSHMEALSGGIGSLDPSETGEQR